MLSPSPHPTSTDLAGGAVSAGQGTGGPQPTGRWILALLVLLLLASLAVRVWYATPDLNRTRYWDERYSLWNVSALLRGDSLRPANGFHPSLSYLPQAGVLAVSGLLHRLTGWEALAVFSGREFSHTAYLLARLTQVVFGVASLWLLFLFGRRLAGPRVALAAVFLLSVVPWHIRQSVIFKPDILLVLTVIAALLASERALARPCATRFAAAGALIGCALASKFNAGPIALPLAVASLWVARRDKRVLVWLFVAGVAAAAVFLILNPYVVLEPELYQRDFSRTVRDYARKGVRHGSSRLFLPLHMVQSLLSGDFHGPLVGSVALVGLVALALATLRRGARFERPMPAVLALLYIGSYVTLYSLATTNPSAHNWLPLTPFTSLAAAWFGAETWRWAAARQPLLASRLAARLAATAVVIAFSTPAATYVYQGVVPTTAEAAGLHMRNRFNGLAGRTIYSEVEVDRSVLRRSNVQGWVIEVEDLSSVPRTQLDYADGEIFPRRRLDEGTGDFYRERLLGRRLLSWVIEPSPFRLRGPAVVAAFHPARRRGRSIAGVLTREREGGDVYRSPLLQQTRPGEMISLEIRLPSIPEGAVWAHVLAGSRSLACESVRRTATRVICISPRFRSDVAPLVRILPPEGLPAEIRFRLWRWRLPRLTGKEKEVTREGSDR